MNVIDVGNRTDLEETLQEIAQQLDLPTSMFEQVKDRYKAISGWLEREESIISDYKPAIYTHGSFALGTVVRPLSDEDEFDFDLICELQRKKNDVTQKVLKNEVGDEVKGYVASHPFKKTVKEWDKCWTMEYSDAGYTFKLDVVPALPDDSSRVRLIKEAKIVANLVDTAVGITDLTNPEYEKITENWARGNPKGFAEWFKGQTRVQLMEAKRIFAKRQITKLAAEEVPDHKVRTPLQQSVQLLKRHRDNFFENRSHQTSSIIITTLAALAYRNEGNLVQAFETIINGMEAYVETSIEGPRVPNPVDPEENFAEAWADDKRYLKHFKEWLDQLQRDWGKIKSYQGESRQRILESSLGQRTTKKAFIILEARNRPTVTTLSRAEPTLLNRFNVPHRQKPENKWHMQVEEKITIVGQYSISGHWKSFEHDSNPLPKGCALQFRAETRIDKPYQVFWQVVNTGVEAKEKGQLRGNIFAAKSVGAGGLFNRENTMYTGTHWVQCYIEKGGICVAQSDPFVVNIH